MTVKGSEARKWQLSDESNGVRSFVHSDSRLQTEHGSPRMGATKLYRSNNFYILSPVATEMPETINALIWVRQGKERLALANI